MNNFTELNLDDNRRLGRLIIFVASRHINKFHAEFFFDTVTAVNMPENVKF